MFCRSLAAATYHVLEVSFVLLSCCLGGLAAARARADTDRSCLIFIGSGWGSPTNHWQTATKLSRERERPREMSAVVRHYSLSSEEVARRKERIATIVVDVKRLLRDQVPSMPVPPLEGEPLARPDVLEAFALVAEAKRLVDSELGWFDSLPRGVIYQHNTQFGNGYYDPREGPLFPPKVDKLFGEERSLFSRSLLGRGDKTGPLFLLPRCFYLPLDEAMTSAKLPGETALKEMRDKAGWIWGAEDHMGFCYETCGEEIVEHEARGDVFWKYGLSHAQTFSECLSEVPWKVIKSDNPIEYLDALRIATRRIALELPNSEDCQHYILLCSELFVMAKTYYDDHFEDKEAKGKDRERAIEEYVKFLEGKAGFQIQSPMKWHLINYLDSFNRKGGE